MKLTTELKEIIIKLINSGNLLKPSPEKIPNGSNILPLYPSGLGWYGINLDGDIVGTDGIEPLKIVKEEDPTLINVALFQGIKRYPELSPLTPIRKEGDLTCPYCKGTGEYSEPSLTVNVLCFCGGLGWIPNRKSV